MSQVVDLEIEHPPSRMFLAKKNVCFLQMLTVISIAPASSNHKHTYLEATNDSISQENDINARIRR